MSVSDLFAWKTPQFKDGEKTLAEEQRARRAEAAKLEREVNRAVDVRDRYLCRVCGAEADPGALDRLKRGHHHHIVFRSKQGEEHTRNKCLLCRTDHDAIHVKRVLEIEGDADVALTFWRRDKGSDEWYVWKREISPRVFEKD